MRLLGKGILLLCISLGMLGIRYKPDVARPTAELLRIKPPAVKLHVPKNCIVTAEGVQYCIGER